MCNRFVQKGREVRPGQRALVLLRGLGGEFEVPFDEAVFGGPACVPFGSVLVSDNGSRPDVPLRLARVSQKMFESARDNKGRTLGLFTVRWRDGQLSDDGPPIDAEASTGHRGSMSTLAEIEEAVPQLSAEELARLERCIRKARLEKQRSKPHSVLDLKPVHLGEMLRPLGDREEWYDEMREGRV